MKLDDFKVGTIVWFRGFGNETEVISIDLAHGTWIGQDCDGQVLYDLDEVEKHWMNSYNHPDDMVAQIKDKLKE